jgi:MFS-type transporter involved in bile tolerance (Atg22 family)
MMKILLILVSVLGLIILMPLATIWSLNTLFPILSIPMNFDTWCASLILGGVVGGTTAISRK